MSHGVGGSGASAVMKIWYKNKESGPRASMSAVDALGNGDPFFKKSKIWYKNKDAGKVLVRGVTAILENGDPL